MFIHKRLDNHTKLKWNHLTKRYASLAHFQFGLLYKKESNFSKCILTGGSDIATIQEYKQFHSKNK